VSETNNDGMLREWGTRLFYGMPKKAKKQGGKSLAMAGGALLSASEVRNRIRHAVSPGAKQVVVKITGGGTGMKAIAAHMRYISRQGKKEVGGRGQTLEVEDENGNKISGAQEIKDLQNDWRVSGSYIEDESRRREAFNVMLSMPAGTPPEAVRGAAREFARETFSGHKYVFVLHEDTDSPHVHLAVKAERWDGIRLHPGPAELQRWRERFAARLQDRGVNAISTRAASRGQRKAPERLWRVKAADKVRVPMPKERSAASVARQRAEALESWKNVAMGLAGSSDPSDRNLAADVVRYVDKHFGDRRVPDRVPPGADRRGPDIERG